MVAVLEADLLVRLSQMGQFDEFARGEIVGMSHAGLLRWFALPWQNSYRSDGSKNGHVFLMVEHVLGLLKGDGCGGGSDRLDR